jgi:hypothetical protein
MTLETPVWLQQGSFPAYQDRLLISALVNPGIPDGPADPVPVPPIVGDLAVTPDASTLSVDVAPGVCFVNGTDQTRQGVYACRNTASVNVPLAARPASGLVRTDLVYAQVIDTSTGITGTDGWNIAAATGVPAGSNPVTPNLPNSALALARVNVTATGGTTFVAGDITDLRVRATSALHAPLPTIIAGPNLLTAPTAYVTTLTPMPGTTVAVVAPGGRKIRVSLQMMVQKQNDAPGLVRGFIMSSPTGSAPWTTLLGSIGPTLGAGLYHVFSMAWTHTPPAGQIAYCFGLSADSGAARVFGDAGSYPGWIMAENIG